MRWSMQLQSPAAVADGRVVTLVDDDGRSARVAVTADGDAVEFAFEASGLPSPVKPAHEEWHNRAHVVVQLNCGHDHATRMQYGVDDAGNVTAAAPWTVPGEEPRDGPAVAVAAPPAGEGSVDPPGENGVRATLRLPAGAVWLAGAPISGLAVKVGFHEEVIPEPLAWPASRRWWEADLPVGYGDLYRAEPDLTVESVEVPRPAWSFPTKVTVRGAVADGGPEAGTITARVVLPDDSVESFGPADWQASGGSFEAGLAAVFPHRGKWEGRQGIAGTLEVTLAADGGKPVWAGSFPFGFDFGIIVRERFGPQGEHPPARPEPSDPDFVEKYRRYILARLPDYRAATTATGAPSDFYLADPDGDGSLDLSARDWPDRLVDFLAGRFDRWDDALAAIPMWLYHPLVTRHSSSWAKISGAVAVDAIPRVGGCFCGDTARAGAFLAERLGKRLDMPLRAWSIGLRGHLATLVDTPVGRVVIDGMIGLWFHALDNTRLATLEEMRADREVVDRMWYCPRRHGKELFFHRYDQIIRAWPAGEARFPDETPE